ncbi:unnamed protein product [Cyclocybe aegerita]|uniref:Peptidase S9 prolyl oligopeptidase catalytic domain-containing protein n=1 Tax=Cyclocybe aegerita TaxID=1973307 RepID=A0A8S0X0B8_CYCAE|nr:unnamed protein product [Cyclocybe aegerita]
MPHLATLLLAVITAYAMVSGQTPFLSSYAWTLQIDPVWDVLGPFPVHAREQHFISPSFPLNLSEPIDYQQIWPSSYADGGTVGWSKANIGVDGYLELSFPDIRWKSLRSYEGWAALQHHAVLRTTLTLHPPSDPIAGSPRLLFDLKQVSYFTIVPQHGSPASPEWHAGNIYDMERALPELVELPTDPSHLSPTKYDLFVSGDYEIRLFGDPLVRNSDVPVQRLGIRVEVLSSTSPVVHQKTQDVSCDFLDGYAFGDALGIGIQSAAGWWTVKGVSATSNQTGLDILLSDVSFTIAPSQTRILPLRIHQTTPFFGETIIFDLTLESGTDSQILSISMPVTQRRLREITGRQVLKGSFFFASSMPSSFLTMPPPMTNVSSAYPPMLALHGAGVDILGQPFWPEALPENKFSWTVIPTGRTSWGLDWHGPSARDAWASLDALSAMTHRRELSLPEGWVIPPDTKVIVIGHSNGGQGTWYFASRYPDKVIAAVPAAAFIKSQAYIPLSLARSGHFIDPSLRAILESSLTPDDNDLHLSNLVDTRVLAFHGGDDENVPVRHSRELSSALKAWYPSANISFQEDAGQGHWYSTVLDNPKTLAFLDAVLSNHDNEEPQSQSFTLTEGTLKSGIPKTF